MSYVWNALVLIALVGGVTLFVWLLATDHQTHNRPPFYH